MKETKTTPQDLHATNGLSYWSVTSAGGERRVDSESATQVPVSGVSLTREMFEAFHERMRNRPLFPEPSSDQLIAQYYMRTRMRNAGLC